MSWLKVLLLFGLPGLAVGDVNVRAIDAGKQQCESRAPGGDSLDIRCSLEPTGSLQRFRFKAHFSGGHDDTRAWMEATLDERPLSCEEGSKTLLEGEEGEVSLECSFSLTEKIGTKRLAVKVRWSHAQYTSFALDSI